MGGKISDIEEESSGAEEDQSRATAAAAQAQVRETVKKTRKSTKKGKVMLDDMKQYRQDKVLTFRDMSHLSYFNGRAASHTIATKPSNRSTMEQQMMVQEQTTE